MPESQTPILVVDLSSMEFGTLPRLAAVCSPPFCFLISTHAGSQRNVHPRRRLETKALRYLVQIKLVHIKYRPKAVAGVSLKVRPIAILG